MRALFAAPSAPPLNSHRTLCHRLLWLKRHEPETYARVKHVMLPHDYVNFWLTGRIVAEVWVNGVCACKQEAKCAHHLKKHA